LFPTCSKAQEIVVVHRVLALTLAAAVMSACSQQPPDVARQYADRGDNFARDGRYSAAVIEYRNAVRNAPASRELHEKLGDALVQLGRIDEAYREYTAASRIVDGQPLPQGEDALRAAIAANPKSAETRIALADLLLTRGDVDEAEDHLLAATATDPANELANRALAALYVAAGKDADAEAHLKSAASHQPQRYRSQIALADFLMEHGRNVEARRVLEGARDDTRLTAAVKLRLAALDYDAGATDKARTDLAELLKANASAEAWTLQANWQFREKKLTEALASAREALALDPQFASAQALTESIRQAQFYPKLYGTNGDQLPTAPVRQ
jgi:tetratricopeptide (TPR) repeat protein